MNSKLERGSVGTLVAALIWLHISGASIARGDPIEDLIWASNHGRPLHLIDIPKLVQDVEATYTNAADRAAIYFRVVDTFGCQQSRDSDTCNAYIDLVKRALAGTQEPASIMQLHVTWGDAIVIGHRGAYGNDLRQYRRDAAEQFLLALRVAIEQKVPAQAPEPVFTGVPIAGETSMSEFQSKKQQKELLERMVLGRNSQVEGVVGLYAKQPFDPEEVEHLAKSILKDDQVVQEIMTKLKVRIGKRGNKPPTSTQAAAGIQN